MRCPLTPTLSPDRSRGSGSEKARGFESVDATGLIPANTVRMNPAVGRIICFTSDPTEPK
jgi:hypothetical protein